MPAVSRIDLGDGILLRAPRPDDAPGVLSVHGDPRVYEHDPHVTQTGLADAERFLSPFLDHWSEHGFGYWTVLVPESWWPEGVRGPAPEDGARVHAGLGGVQRHVLADEPVLNVYYRLGPAVHGRGVAGAIVRTTQQHAPRLAPGIDPVVRTRPANAVARRVAERAGFVDLGLEPGTTDMQLLRWGAGPRPRG
ncbi:MULTISPECIES: GNAT family N-acetyltransferase [Nocardioides]|uniref:GNAT family N-acetyltransferase n=1 Tax=Nocardioides vastitatis TaxID=2568655 RepID=A0ABW0ZCF3_9ACTN|nr:GNAT family N-acetyltransferase [Nocardioides sp.]THJ00543.1 GNAT family N-acetyltransferase [Nocardioides sp.]